MAGLWSEARNILLLTEPAKIADYVREQQQFDREQRAADRDAAKLKSRGSETGTRICVTDGEIES